MAGGGQQHDRSALFAGRVSHGALAAGACEVRYFCNLWVFWCILWFGLGLWFCGAAYAGADRPSATDAVLTVKGKTTIFDLTMSKGVTAEVFSLASPYRVIIDLPDLTFELNPAAGQKGAGLVDRYRYGLFAENKARIVIDTKGPVKISSATMSRVNGGPAIRLSVVLEPTDKASFGAGTGATKSAGLTHGGTGSPAEPAPGLSPDILPGTQGPKQQVPAGHKPVVVIDPGHGGIDPGAMGLNNVPEKSIVLAVAERLKAALEKTGGYEVKMTRSSDVFVSLDQRLRFSHDAAADLFISLHADSIEEKKVADSIRGATIYTLSERASDERSRAMAEKENSSDLIAGLETADGEGQDQVRSILFDLLRRETSNFSADFSQVLSKRLGKTIAMSRVPRRSAAFKVLKQAHAPSVLVELGYISNQQDQEQMTSREWQSKVADAITAAVQTYFGKRTSERH